MPRVMQGGDVGVLESEMAKTIFTHHQKFVLTDAEDPESGKRRLIAFLGINNCTRMKKIINK